MRHAVTYRIVEVANPSCPSERWFEVWGRNAATGYEWLIAEYDSLDKASMMIRHWQETAA